MVNKKKKSIWIDPKVINVILSLVLTFSGSHDWVVTLQRLGLWSTPPKTLSYKVKRLARWSGGFQWCLCTLYTQVCVTTAQNNPFYLHWKDRWHSKFTSVWGNLPPLLPMRATNYRSLTLKTVNCRKRGNWAGFWYEMFMLCIREASAL